MNTQLTSTAINRQQRPRMKVIRLTAANRRLSVMKAKASAKGSVQKQDSKSKPFIRKKAVIERLLPASNATSKVVMLKKRIPARVSLSNDSSRSLGTLLLSDIKAIFKSTKAHQLRTQSILDALNSDPKKPWATFYKGQGIGPRQLASLLKQFGIHSQDLRFSGSAYKGYKREWFLDSGNSHK